MAKPTPLAHHARALQVVRPDRPLPEATANQTLEQATFEVSLAGRRYRLVSIDDGDDRSLDLAGVLTARELQVVALVAEGQPNKLIADRLHISEWTVSTHLRRIFAKLRVDTRAAMVSRCLQLVRSNR